jgi:hypothetical protein
MKISQKNVGENAEENKKECYIFNLPRCENRTGDDSLCCLCHIMYGLKAKCGIEIYFSLKDI